jgi:predicted Zn-ribbon and HTH transcriptional regulator
MKYQVIKCKCKICGKNFDIETDKEIKTPNICERCKDAN